MATYEQEDEEQRGDEAIRTYNEEHRIDPDCAFGAVRKIVNSLVTAKPWIDLFVFGCICIVNYFGTEYSFIGTIVALVTVIVFIIMKTVLRMKGHLDGEQIFEYAVAMYAIAAPLLVFSMLIGYAVVVGESIGDNDKQEGIFMGCVILPNTLVSMAILTDTIWGCIICRVWVETIRAMEHKNRNVIIGLVMDSVVFVLFLYLIVDAVAMITFWCFSVSCAMCASAFEAIDKKWATMRGYFVLFTANVLLYAPFAVVLFLLPYDTTNFYGMWRSIISSWTICSVPLEISGHVSAILLGNRVAYRLRFQ